jgi:hypothetical protein
MTEADAIRRFLGGEPVRIVEYRSTNAQRIKWTDKDTGKALEAPICKHDVEGAPDGRSGVVEAISVSERLPEDADVETMKSPFKKGERVVLVYFSQMTLKGAHSAQGRLEPLILAGK